MFTPFTFHNQNPYIICKVKSFVLISSLNGTKAHILPTEFDDAILS